MTTDEPGAEAETPALAERLRYAPGRVDPEDVVSAVEAADPAVRAVYARSVASLAPDAAADLADLAGPFADLLDGDVDGRRAVVEALAALAAGDPAAVRPYADRLVEELSAYNVWVSRAAAEALAGIAAADPETAAAVEPLLDATRKRTRARAASVVAAAAATSPGVGARFLDDCVDLVTAHPVPRVPATRVLARAGWVDPGALGPAVDALVLVARGEDIEAADREFDPTARSEADGTDVRVAAFTALRHAAGAAPDRTRTAVDACVDAAVAEEGELARAAASVLVTLALQDPSVVDDARAAVADASYFDRSALVRALADASADIPGGEYVLFPFCADESRFIRDEVYRQCSPGDP
ncbi:MAG: hypothetical protein ABEJ40_02450 [Haloarculaceae archaeon]